jgi:hypothetical protein
LVPIQDFGAASHPAKVVKLVASQNDFIARRTSCSSSQFGYQTRSFKAAARKLEYN